MILRPFTRGKCLQSLLTKIKHLHTASSVRTRSSFLDFSSIYCPKLVIFTPKHKIYKHRRLKIVTPIFSQISSSRAQHLGVKTTKATKLPSDPKPPYISLLIGWRTVIHSIFFTKALFCLIWLSFNAPRKNSAAYNLKPTPNGSKYFVFPLSMQGTSIWAAAQAAFRFTTLHNRHNIVCSLWLSIKNIDGVAFNLTSLSRLQCWCESKTQSPRRRGYIFIIHIDSNCQLTLDKKIAINTSVSSAIISIL